MNSQSKIQIIQKTNDGFKSVTKKTRAAAVHTLLDMEDTNNVVAIMEIIPVKGTEEPPIIKYLYRREQWDGKAKAADVLTEGPTVYNHTVGLAKWPRTVSGKIQAKA